MARPERSFLHMMNDEVVDKILHSVSVTSDNVDVQLDHGNARSEDVADLSSVESFDSILLEPASVMGLNKATKMFFLVIAIVFCFFVSYHSLPKLTGKTVPKFRTKLSAKTKTAKANGSGNANDAEESTSSQWDSLPMDTEPLGDHDLCTTNLSSEQVDLVQMSSLEAGSPEVSRDGVNELHSWNDDEQTQQTLGDQSTSKALEEHGASKSSRIEKENFCG